MNIFDAVVYALLIVAIATGYRAGFLRSLATILGYAIALPIAVAGTLYVTPAVSTAATASWHGSLAFFVNFLLAGLLFGAMMRSAVNAMIGPSVDLPDRLLGSLFGAIRIGLIAVTVVLVFDRIIPPDREPAFLVGSRVRPVLSIAGQHGLKTLPPDVIAYIDQLKQERRL
jgi:membrane protein required for colicin V production